MSEQSILSLANSCPRCHRGRLFAGFVTLEEACGTCGLAYQREEGQVWGAMVLAYGFSAALALPLFLVLMVYKQPALLAIGIPVALIALLSPLNVRISRQIWTHAMYHLHPNGRG